MLSEKYGLVHISCGDLVRREISQGSAVGKKVVGMSERGELVPDDVVFKLILNEIESTKAESKGWIRNIGLKWYEGWVLDGIPRTKGQMQLMNQEGIIPDKFIVFESNEEQLMKRITGRRISSWNSSREGRRVDPVTNRVYHLEFDPPQESEVKKRLIERKDDDPQAFKKRIEDYNNHLRSIVNSYGATYFIANASTSKESLFGSLCKYLDYHSFKEEERQSLHLSFGWDKDILEQHKSSAL